MDCHEFYQLLFQLVSSLHRSKLISNEEKGQIKDEIIKGDLSKLVSKIRTNSARSHEAQTIKMVECIKEFIELQRIADNHHYMKSRETCDSIQSYIDSIWELDGEDEQEEPSPRKRR